MGQRSQDRKEPRYFKVTVVEYLFTTFYYQLWFMVGLCLFVTIIFHFQVDPICGLATEVHQFKSEPYIPSLITDSYFRRQYINTDATVCVRIF